MIDQHDPMRIVIIALTLAALVLAPQVGAQTVRAYDHIFVIVEENTEYERVIGEPRLPTLNQLASTGGLATQYFGTVHPSEGNYVSLVGGSAYGIHDDVLYTTHTVDQPSLVDQIEAAGLTWKGYFQSMPSAGYAEHCYPANPCLYVSQHNGFLNFAHVQGSEAEKQRLVPDTSLADDLASGNVPNLAFIIPDVCHDLHGAKGCQGDALYGGSDQYLSTTVNAILGSSTWQQGANALVITFDEGDSPLGCCGADPGGGRVVTVVVRNDPQAGPMQDPTPYNHYSLVATLQAAFGLGCQMNGTPVGVTCEVTPMRPLFGLPG
jgi:phosphatidylinositol-3-phosphatase